MKGCKYMVQIVAPHNIEEILRNPSNYIDDEQDVVLLKVYGQDANNPTMIMVGVDEEDPDCENAEPWYIVEEDNDVSIYHSCSINNLYATYEKVLEKVMKEAEK